MMPEQDMIHMTNRELKRLHFIKKAIDNEITQKHAAEACGLSERQVRRIITRVREGGARAIIHKSRGQPSHASLPTRLKQRIIALYKAKYPDFGPTLASEKFQEHNRIKIHPETLRLWLKEFDVPYRTRKKRPHREWRERRAALGEMIQMDGSHHDWLEGRGPWLVLMGYIDDATGNVFARFYDFEGTFPAMDSFLRYVQKYGLPQSVYLDKHTTYKSNAKPTLEEELQGKDPKSQFERALGQLRVDVIHAHSPQAKGRIERLFATFQDRLVKELRLSKAKNKDEANCVLEKYLPKFNRRFTIEPRTKANLHRPVPNTLNLRRVLSIHNMRALQNDNTIRYNGQLCLIKNHWTQRRPKEILVVERSDGRTHLFDHGRRLEYREVKEPPKKVHRPKSPKKLRRVVIPTKAHPWRHMAINPPDIGKPPQNGATPRNVLRLSTMRATFQTQGISDHAPKRDSSTHSPYPLKSNGHIQPERGQQMVLTTTPLE